MTESVTNQFMVFLFTILTGVLAGLFYDVYAGLGQVVRLRKIGILVGDIIFWLVLTPAVFALLLYFNQGEVRFFVLIGFCLGAGSYFLIFQRKVRMLIVNIIKQVIKFFRLVARAFCWMAMVVVLPFKIIYLAVTYPFRLLGLGMGFAGRGIRAGIKFIIPKPIKRLIRKITNIVSRLLKRIKPRT